MVASTDAVYLRHGVRIRTNLPLVGRPEADTHADVRVVYCEEPVDVPLPQRFVRRWSHANGRAELAFQSGRDHCLRFSYSEGASVVDIHNTVADDAATVAAIFSGPGLAVLLSLRGVLVLHGAAVAVGDQALLFVGASGSGKSTLAAALSLAGASFISEEIVSVRHNGPLPQTGYGCPRIGLEPDAAACFGGLALPRVYPGRSGVDKRWLNVEPQTSGPRDWIEVRAVYVLGPRCLDGPARFAEMNPVDATTALLGAVYPRTGMFPDRNMQDVARLVDRLPVWSVRLPQNLHALPDVARSVIAHAAAVLQQ